MSKGEGKRKQQEQPEEKKTYTVETIKVAAYNWKDLPPQDLSMPERCLWLTLANIYKRFRDGELSKEQGEELKQKAMVTYNADKALLEMHDTIIAEQAALWKRIETAGNKYGVERTIKAADAFFESVYGVTLRKPNKAENSTERAQNDE